MSLVPSPLKSPMPSTCKLVPTAPSVGADCTALLFMTSTSRVRVPPASRCNRMSLVPLLLKSPIAIHDPVRTDRADIELGLHPTRVHLIDQKRSRRGGRIINVDEEVG